MPDRAGLDDDESLKSLIGLWRDGAADLDARLASVHDRLRSELGSVSANTVERLRLQAVRLEELQGVASHIADDLAQGTKRWLDDGGLARVYVAGGGVTARASGTPFSFVAPHRAAVEVLAADLYDDVLVATRFIDDDSKRFVRDVGRRLTGFKLTSGTPAQAQGRRLARELRDEFGRRGMGSMVYRDGSRHSFGEYGEMLLRTKTGVAYNTGTLNQARLVGIRWFELLDGALCGLTSHQDGQLANGLIVDFETAMSFPLSHPNCRRSVNPRPDLEGSGPEGAVSVQSPGARADQAAFEAALRAQGRRRAGGRARRERRARSRNRAADERRAAREARAARRGVQDEFEFPPHPDPTPPEVLSEVVEAAGKIDADRVRRGAGRRPKDPAVLERWNVTEAQWRDARAVVDGMRRDVRAKALEEANELRRFLEDNSLHKLLRPKRLVRQSDEVFGSGSRFVRSQSGYDWMEQLPKSDRNRLLKRFVDDPALGGAPDELAERMRVLFSSDATDDDAMRWLLDQWTREDGLRSVASGRLPGYTELDALMPADYGLDGYRLRSLFDPDLDEAAGHVASVQAEQAVEYARRSMPDLGTGGRRPWEMSVDDFVAELERVEEAVRNRVPVSSDPEFGDFFSPADELVYKRWQELSPPDLDPEFKLSAADLHFLIQDTARAAGFIE